MSPQHPRGCEDGKHPRAVLFFIGYLSSDWSEFRAVTQNRELRMRATRPGLNSAARKPVQVAVFQPLCCPDFVRELLCDRSDSIAFACIDLRQVFGNRENAGLAFELDLVRGVGSDLDLSRFHTKPGHDVLNRATFIELGQHQFSIAGIFPNPQFMDGMTEHLGAGVTVSALEGSIHIHEPSFFERSDRKRYRTRTKHLLKLLFRGSAAVFRLRQGDFGFLEAVEARFERLPVDACCFVELGVLDGGGGGNRQQFRAPEMLLGVKAWLGVPNRETSQILTGRDQRGGEPGTELLVSLEGLPLFFRLCVGDQDALLLRQDTMEKC